MNKLSVFLSVGLLCGSAQAATSIKIASISPLSGSNSNMGLQVKNGAQLALNDMKAELAKAGLNVSLVAYDDQADPATGTAAARRAVADKQILGVVGTLNSGVAIPASAAMAPSHLVLVSPLNVSAKVTDRGLKNVSRICARDDAQGPAAGAFVVENLKAKKVYVLNDKTPYGQGLADQAEKEMRKRGATIVQSEGVAAEERDFTAIITKIQTLKPDAIFFGGMYGQVGPFAKQLRDKGITTPIVGGDGYDSDDLMKLAGSGATNIYFTTIAPPVESVPAAKTAAANFQKAFNSDMQGFGVMSYDAGRVLLTAILNAYKQNGDKVPSRAQVETAVRAGTYAGLLTGEVKFNAVGDRKLAKMYVISVREGKRGLASTLNVSRQ